MSRFLSSRFCGLSAYVPGEQPRDTQYIKLNTNESPFPPSPGVIGAVSSREMEDLRLYSDPQCGELRRALADYYNVQPENITVGNGSDEILNFAFMGFCDGDTGVAYPDISYGFYSVFARLYGLWAREIPLREDFSIAAEDYCGLGKTVVIANPNAPTGLFLSLEEIEKIVMSNSENVVIIDEAYIDFGGESAIPLTRKYPNLLVVQTFSKSRSLAGARLGFAVGSAELIVDLEKLRYSTNPYNINRLTQAAGCQALREFEYYNKNCKEIILNREYTVKKLEELGFFCTDSKTNFVFAKSSKIGGGELYKRLRQKGILVRHFGAPRIEDFVRITVGTRSQMETLISVLKEIGA